MALEIMVNFGPGLPPNQQQAIIWNYADLLIVPLETEFSNISMKMSICY